MAFGYAFVPTNLLQLFSLMLTTVWFKNILTFIMPHPHRVGHYALMAVVCLSVCLSRSWP